MFNHYKNSGHGVLVCQRSVLSPVTPTRWGYFHRTLLDGAGLPSSVLRATPVPTPAHIHISDSRVLDTIRVNFLQILIQSSNMQFGTAWGHFLFRAADPNNFFTLERTD